MIAAGVLYFVVDQLDAAAAQRQQNAVTMAALAQAKEALIAYAATVNLQSGSARPGDLPCPDLNGNGVAESREFPALSCGDAGGSNPERRLGRLPWRTLGLPDLRDASGEGLWYAVSNNFKERSRTALLNSDSPGTISIRDSAGNILHDGSLGNGVVAVVIAPGPPLRRQDGLDQDRSGTNLNVAAHFLDNAHGEDNANFVDGETNGFLSGPVRDPTDAARVIANDRLLVITRDEINATMEKRVAAEILKCLVDYAADPANGGRYPWAAAMAGYAASSFGDTANTLFGRFPDLLCATAGDAVSLPCDSPPAGTNPAMQTVWPTSCSATNAWFANWREQVFYAVASGYKPGIAPPSCVSGCLSIDGSASDKQVAVLVAGRRVPPQTRTDKADPAEYLEGSNRAAGTAYVTGPMIPGSFNDVVRFR